MQRSPGSDVGPPWVPPTEPVVYGAWAPPPHSPRKPWYARPLLWVLAAVGLLLIPVLVSAVTFFKTAMEDIQDVETAATSYLDAVRDGDQARLDAVTCERSRPALLGILKSYQVTDTHIEVVNGDASATVTARVAVRDGGSQTVVLTLQQSSGTWVVCDR
jgi:archaellum component FlaF (FlaF/FlaG flagellin family)